MEVVKRVQAGWRNWQRLSGGMYDRNLSAKKERKGVQGGSETSHDVWS